MKCIQDKVVFYGFFFGIMIIEIILFKFYNFVLENGNYFKLFQMFLILNLKKLYFMIKCKIKRRD